MKCIFHFSNRLSLFCWEGGSRERALPLPQRRLSKRRRQLHPEAKELPRPGGPRPARSQGRRRRSSSSRVAIPRGENEEVLETWRGEKKGDDLEREDRKEGAAKRALLLINLPLLPLPFFRPLQRESLNLPFSLAAFFFSVLPLSLERKWGKARWEQACHGMERVSSPSPMGRKGGRGGKSRVASLFFRPDFAPLPWKAETRLGSGAITSPPGTSHSSLPCYLLFPFHPPPRSRTVRNTSCYLDPTLLFPFLLAAAAHTLSF